MSRQRFSFSGVTATKFNSATSGIRVCRLFLLCESEIMSSVPSEPLVGEARFEPARPKPHTHNPYVPFSGPRTRENRNNVGC